MNERKITMHLVKACVSAALQPFCRVLWSPFLPSTQVICSHKPQLLFKAIFSACPPTCHCKISHNLSKGCVFLSKISGTCHCMCCVHLGQHRRGLKSPHKKGCERKDEMINTWQIHSGHSLQGNLSCSY